MGKFFYPVFSLWCRWRPVLGLKGRTQSEHVWVSIVRPWIWPPTPGKHCFIPLCPQWIELLNSFQRTEGKEKENSFRTIWFFQIYQLAQRRAFPKVYLSKQRKKKKRLGSQKPDFTHKVMRFSNIIAVILDEQEEGSGRMDGRCILLSEEYTSINGPSCISEIAHSEHVYTQRCHLVLPNEAYSLLLFI